MWGKCEIWLFTFRQCGVNALVSMPLSPVHFNLFANPFSAFSGRIFSFPPAGWANSSPNRLFTMMGKRQQWHRRNSIIQFCFRRALPSPITISTASYGYVFCSLAPNLFGRKFSADSIRALSKPKKKRELCYVAKALIIMCASHRADMCEWCAARINSCTATSLTGVSMAT